MKNSLLGLLIVCFVFFGFTLVSSSYKQDGSTEAVIHNCKTGSPVAMFALPEKYMGKDGNLATVMHISLRQENGDTMFSLVTDKLEVTLPELEGTYVMTVTLGEYQVLKTITLR